MKYLTAAVLLCFGFASGLPPRQLPAITGGEQAEYGEYPWILSFQRGTRHFCGASIIDKDWAMTAAHCTDGQELEGLSVVAGEYDQYVDEGREQRIEIDYIVQHKEYFTYPDFGGAPINDISLMKLKKPIQFNDNIKPVRLPEANQPSSGILEAAGWGVESMSGPIMRFLMKVELPIVSDEECRERYDLGSDVIPDSELCAAEDVVGKSTCSGDSGGPMVCKDSEGSTYQCGIVSWGPDVECGTTLYPSVFAEVSHFIDWINENKK